MARFNELLVGRYNRLAQKLFGMKGRASLVSVSDELIPVLSIFHGIELHPLHSWSKFYRLVTNPQNVAGPSGIRFRNPAGSNVIGIIEKISILSGSAEASTTPLVVEWGKTVIGSADLATVDSLARGLDPRGQTLPVCHLSTGYTPAQEAFNSQIDGYCNTEAGAGVQMLGFQQLIWLEEQQIPVLPAFGIQLRSQVAGTGGQSLFAAFVWRERLLEDSELL